MDINVLKVLIDQSPVAALALLSLYMLRQSYADRLKEANGEVERWRERCAAERDDKKLLVGVLSDVAGKLGEMAEAIRFLNQRGG